MASGIGGGTKTAEEAADAAVASRERLADRPLGVAAVVVILLIAVSLPLIMSGFRLFQFTQVLTYAIALLGLNLLTGYNGQFSLGHGAFYGIGAYTTAIMIDRWDIGYGWTILAAGIVCLVVGFLFGRPALRLEGLYLALATFPLALAVPRSSSISSTGPAARRDRAEQAQAPFGLRLTEDMALLSDPRGHHRPLRPGLEPPAGRVGRAIVAIRDNHIAAEAMGIDNALYKSVVFGVSAAYTGIAGALSALAIAFVAPDSFNILLSITLLTGIVIGGFATISGAIYGALFVQFVPNWAQDISKAALLGHLRRLSHRVHVRHASRHRRFPAPGVDPADRVGSFKRAGSVVTFNLNGRRT